MRPFVFTGNLDGPIERALVDSGVISQPEMNGLRRVVIDLQIGTVAKIYVEKLGDQQAITDILQAGIFAGTEPKA